MADFAGAKAAIKAYLAAYWSSFAVVWPNEPKPSLIGGDGNPVACWIYGEIAGTKGQIHGVGVPGDHVVVDDGLIQFTAFVPADTGLDVADAQATALGEVFRVKQFFDAEPGTCIRTWTPSIGADTASAESGMWVGVTVTIPFEFWHRA